MPVELDLRGGCRQLGKLIVADFGLGHQHAAAKVLDQVAADRAKPPSRQRPGRTMTDDDEVGSDLFGDACDLLSGGSHAEPRRWGEADGLESLHAFLQDCLIGCDLIVDRDRDAALQRRAEGRLDNSQQEHFGAAKLRELRALPQRQPPLDGTVIGKKNFLVQDSPPSFAALTSNPQFSTNLSAHIGVLSTRQAVLEGLPPQSLAGSGPPNRFHPRPGTYLRAAIRLAGC